MFHTHACVTAHSKAIAVQRASTTQLSLNHSLIIPITCPIHNLYIRMHTTDRKNST